MTNQPVIDAVLLMAHGGPDKIADIPEFLAHIRKGRPISPEFLNEVVARYELIGGASPLRQISESLAGKLEDKLKLPVYLGMRHFHPFIDQTLRQIAGNGHKNVLGICLAPHYSTLSILAYQNEAMKANAELDSPLDLHFVDSYGCHPDFVSFHAKQILLAHQELAGDDWSQTHVLLTAHSLPARILQNADPYLDQLNESTRAITEALKGITKPSLCFQSASPSPEPWLVPEVEETLKQLATKGLKNIIIAPIGFVAEHVEILYDIDIAFKELGGSLGIKIKRTAMLNDRPEMLAILSDLVEQSKRKVTRKFEGEHAGHFLE